MARVWKRIVIAVSALGVGGLAAALVLGALVGLSESHDTPGTVAMVWHAEIQLGVAALALLWSIFVLLTVIWRGSRRDLAALAAAAVSQACLCFLLAQSGVVRAWTEVPVTVAAIASMSVAFAWCLALIGF